MRMLTYIYMRIILNGQEWKEKLSKMETSYTHESELVTIMNPQKLNH